MKIQKTIPDWLIGVIITIIFLFITLTGIFDFTDPIEMKTFDLRARLAAPTERSKDIEVVSITDDDLSELGRFPWPRDIIAQGVHNLSLAGAKVIALNILFMEPEESAGLKAIKGLKDEYDSLGLAQKGPGLTFYQRLSKTEEELDNDAKLYKAIKDAGNVVLPVYFDMESSGRDQAPPQFVTKYAYKHVIGEDDDWLVSSLYWPTKITPILTSFSEVAAGIGHNNLFADSDGYIRRQIHVLGYLKNIYFPSYPISIVKAFQGLKDEDISVYLGEGVNIKLSPSKTVEIPVMDYTMRTLISWNKGPDNVFHHTPFIKVYKNEFQTSLFKDKIVIVGPTAQGIGNRYVTPIYEYLPGVEVVANSVSNILKSRFISRPSWISFAEFGILILFGLFIALGLPKLKAGMGAIMTLALFIVFGIISITLFFSTTIWLKISPPILLLIIGYILIISKRFLITERTKEKVEADSAETNKMLGLSFQQQGMLDLALEKFRKISLDEEGSKDLLYNLGLDFERKRQFSKALSTYKMIISDKENFKDLDERIPKLKGAEATMIFGNSGGHPGDIGATLLDMDTKPTLGRYEVTGELGRGAMGVVYKGEDPKIHRTVAIKTVKLSDFDDDIIDEMKERFFREAESAGVLAHPNIVTIYDAGEEHDLAFIAMEFLNGEDLEAYTKPENLLSLRETLSIIADVAEALDYAHEKGIVHRDIKPANIMRDTETKEVKVTDFGIARISSSSKTKTGIILGTPSYMSPEQVAGKKVDGRSDIFSLGVVMFQLLTGEKPFQGEDITSLMFKISNDKQPSAKSLNQRIPIIVDKIIDMAMEKDKDKRYQKAGQMSAHLKQVIQKIDELRVKKGQ